MKQIAKAYSTRGQEMAILGNSLGTTKLLWNSKLVVDDSTKGRLSLYIVILSIPKTFVK